MTNRPKLISIKSYYLFEIFMTQIVIRHFGGLRVTVGGQDVALPSDFPHGLFAYLTHHANQMIARGQVSAVFWPDLSEKRARRALSTALWRIGHVAPIAPFLVRSASSVGFIASRIWVDTVAFERHLRHAKRLATAMPASALMRVVRMIRTSSQPAFANLSDEWGLQQRFMFENFHCDTLYLGAQISATINDTITLTECARQLIAREPYREDIRELQMQHAAQNGHLLTAQRHFDTYQDMIATEYGNMPEKTLVQMTTPRESNKIMPAIEQLRAALGALEDRLRRERVE